MRRPPGQADLDTRPGAAYSQPPHLTPQPRQAMPESPSKKHSRTGIALRAILLVGGCAFLSWRFLPAAPDLPRLVEIISGARPWPILACLGLHSGGNLLRTWRLHLVLQSRAGFFTTYNIYNAGNLLNALLPLRAGEFGMALLFASRAGIPGGEGLSRLFVDRLLDLMVVLAFMLGALWALLPASGAGAQSGVILYACAALAAVVGATFAVVACEDALAGLVRRISARLLRRDPEALEGQFRLCVEGLRALFRVGVFAPALGVSFLAWGLVVWSYEAGMAAFFTPPPVGCAVAATCLTVFGLVAVPVPAGTGTTHAAIVAALSMYGVGLEQALVYAVFYHALTVGTNIAMGLMSAHAMGFGPGAMLRLVRQGNPTAKGRVDNA